MKQFFKFVFASTVGTLLALGILFIIGLILMNILVNQVNQPPIIAANSVLELNFNKTIPEQTNNLEINPFDFNQAAVLGVHDYIDLIERAKTDDAIEGIYLSASSIPAGFATLTQIRDALVDFSESDKFIVAYAPSYSQAAYYLASTADTVYLHPLGEVDLRGFAATVPFFTNMLEKIGVDMQVFYAGKFKGATESYRLTALSDENRQQIREYLNQMYAEYLEDISFSREIPVSELRAFANAYAGWDSKKTLDAELVDVIGYADDAQNMMRRRLGLEKEDKVKLVSANRYFSSDASKTDYSIRDRVAIIYAEGAIVDGEGENGMIGAEKYQDIIRRVRRDDRVKAVVLRVNSPGGSAMASETLWRELELLEEAGKPLVISMGDYAASGGYYLATAGDTILAQENTLTGSIGVFSIIPSFEELMNDKLGITFDTVKTGRFSTGISTLFDLSEAEGEVLQEHTIRTYRFFMQRVAESRGLTIEQVDSIAQGRVWTGVRAEELGLVDKIGDLEEAIATAAYMAGLEKHRPLEYPRVKDPMEQLMEEFLDTDQARTNAIKTELGEYYPYYERLKMVKEQQGVQAILPFVLDIR